MNSGNNKHTYAIWIITAFIVILAALAVKVGYQKYEAYKLAKIRQEMEQNILEGATARPISVNVNYGKQIANGSPLIFGGAHTPLPDHTDAWNKIEDIGVTMLRRDFFIEQIIPSSTIEQYKANVNNIQDPNTWNKDSIGYEKSRFKLARVHHMKTMGILSYTPGWLTYNGTPFSVPRDWTVYEDIVKKIYKIFRDDIDYLEVWNEPTYDRFLKVDGSGLTTEEAYVAILQHAMKAIREVDAAANDGKKIPIGGLVADNPKRTAMLKAILEKPDVINKLDYISYHNYGNEEPSSEGYKDLMRTYNKANIPLMITEWNYSSDEVTPNDYKISDKAMMFTANQFIAFLKQGIAGANYFIMEPIEYPIPGVGQRYMGFYRWKGDHAELLPQSKVWKLMSKTLKLGAGPSKVTQTEEEEPLQAVGAVNNEGGKVLALTNQTDSPQLVQVELSNLGITKRALVYIYVVSKDFNGEQPVRTELAEIHSNSLKTRFYMPEQSIAGVVVKQFNDTWFDIFDAITKKK